MGIVTRPVVRGAGGMVIADFLGSSYTARLAPQALTKLCSIMLG
ncbi:hypothetical protein HMPREF1978_01617 [Actinomyces graevenitzii F0530]|uniref:Uncharacterized protein n=1 Tax=Actinomyces graevenitzii F0530 TaxID=1321817 RepID=U1PW66_9ACTO|nr:hypothetical protein HMPREF1978_01617 [Actinomyces graevenitzii F0530]